MASAGPNFPITSVDDATVGTVAWVNPGNATADDGVFATCTMTVGATGHFLKTTNYAFAIPSDATIRGVRVDWKKKCGTSNTVLDNSVMLVVSGSITGTDLKNGINWVTTSGYITYGSAGNLWGNTLTPAIINAANFGAALSPIDISGGGGSVASIDAARIIVTYSQPGAPPAAMIREIYFPSEYDE